MGRIIPNVRRAVQSTLLGLAGTEVLTVLEEGRVLSYQQGRPEGNRADNEPYVVARVQVDGGRLIRVVIVGDEMITAVVGKYPAEIRAASLGTGLPTPVIKEWKGKESYLSAMLEPMGGGGQGRVGQFNAGDLLPQGNGFRSNDGRGFILREIIVPGQVPPPQAAPTQENFANTRLGRAVAGWSTPSTHVGVVHPPTHHQSEVEQRHAEQANTMTNKLIGLISDQAEQKPAEQANEEASS